MSRLRISLLGGCEIRGAAGSASIPRKSAALLAALARSPGGALSREKLAALLWSESPEAQARDSLRHALAALRRGLERAASVLRGEGSLLILDGRAEVDVADFEAALGAGDLERAVALYRGDFLQGFELREPAFEEWLAVEREALRRKAVDAMQRLLRRKEAAGEIEGAIELAERLLALDPAQEGAHRSLMQLYARQGRRSAALRQYHLCVAALRRDLDAEPEPETQRLYRELLEPAAGAEATAERPLRGLAGEPPLIGRERALARLGAAFAAAREGRAGFILVEGEAGVGKTRLVGEFAVDAVGRMLQGYAFENERTLPFGVWVDALRRAGAPADPSLLAGLAPGWRAELARVFPELAVPGVPSAPPARDPTRLFAAFAELLRLIANRPTVLVLEDFHWADDLSARLLSFVARRLNDRPILLVATARSEELAEASALRRAFGELERERRLERLPLAPLSRADSAALVRGLAPRGSAPAAVAAWSEALWPLSQGNPFVIVEAMRALREGGSLGPGDAPGLPESVRALIEGRIERLSAAAQEALALAAAIGRDFEFGLLAAALGDEPRAAEAVEELVRRRLLHSVDDRFDFTHERTRNVAYARILASRRMLLHRAVGEALERRYARDLAPHFGAFAHHFELGESWAKAVRYLRAAAAQAAARSAHAEAAARLERALKLVAERPVGAEAQQLAIDLRLDLRNALMVLGEFERILVCLGEAAKLARAAGDDGRLARVGCSMVHVLRVAGHYEEAIEAGREAIALARGDPVIEVQANFYMGAAFYGLGDYPAGCAALERCIELSDARADGFFGLPFRPATTARLWLAWCLGELGRFDEAAARSEECRVIAERSRDRARALEGLIAPGFAFALRGEFARAIPFLKQGLATARQDQIAIILPWVEAQLGAAYVGAGRIDDGLPLLAEAVSRTERMRLAANRARYLALLGEARLRAGDRAAAFADAEAAVALARAHREAGHEAWALWLLGESAPEAGREAPLRDALARAEALGMRPLAARCRLSLAELLAQRGEGALAAAEACAAAALFREMGLTAQLEQAEALASLSGSARAFRGRGRRASGGTSARP